METSLNLKELAKTLEKGGKNELLKSIKTILQDNSKIFIENSEIKKILYEFCLLSIQGHVKCDQVISCLIEVSNLHSGIPSLLADILLVLDFETICLDKREPRERFTTLVIECNKKVIAESLLRERLEFDTLTECAPTFKKSAVAKFIKVKTRLFYKQQKFNLFREESEGYSKLVTELNHDFGPETSSKNATNIIKSLIGCFNLDPNRVCDILLESFECQLSQEDFFIDLLRNFVTDSETISQLVGFKFSFYRDGTTEETSQSLYKLAAVLLKHKALKLDQIYNQLIPKDSEMVEWNKQQLQDAKNFARKYNSLNLADKSEEKNVEEPTDNKPPPEFNNQKLGLCAALIEIGDWNNILIMINQLPEFYAVSFPMIATRLCYLINYSIEPLYSRFKSITKSRTKVALLKNNCKQVTTIKEFSQYILPMVLALGPYLHVDPVLIVKILRISKGVMADRPNHPEDFHFHILSMLDESLLPSLSLIECNCCLAEEFWNLIKLFPYHQRFCLYNRWKNETFINQPLLIRARAEALKTIKYKMKRLSKDSVKPSGRSIGKISHSSPGFLFEYILSQIQTWDNLIIPVVDSLKYLTSLSYDVLSYCLVEALSNPAKERMKHTGISISPWLQSLSNFCGAIYKKYPIDLIGLLQYVANQLKHEKCIDLLILKEIVQKMAGIEFSEEMTQEQIEALAGGELLRSEGGCFNQMRNTKKSSLRLKEALLEQELALPLCLLMAQQRNYIIYREPECTHLKLVSQLYDQCQDTLVQFGSFLATNLSMDEYNRQLPPIAKLLSDYHIQADVAFFLSRPMLNHLQNCKFEELKKQEKGYKNLSSVQKLQAYTLAVEQINDPIIEQIRPLFPSKTWEDLSPQFYMTFWSLSLYDLLVPSSSYRREINKYDVLIAQADENKDLVASKKKKEKERCRAIMDKLLEEEKKQNEHCGRVQARLKNEKESWFLRCAKNDTVTQFLQLCVFPRCIFTSLDALFCARFVHLLHTLKTPNFSTLICYDRIFFDITYAMTSCTENEAARYGRFLCGVLETVMKWHSNRAIFEKECANYPGFMTKLRVGNQSSDNSTDHVDYENYRRVCYKWHFKITKAFLLCLESKDYVQIRNSLVVMIKILPFYPMVTNLGQALERRVEKIKVEQKEKRPDLFAMATMYAGQLKGKKPTLVPEREFHLKEALEIKNPNKRSTAPAPNNAANADTENIKTEPSSKSSKISSSSNSKTITTIVKREMANGKSRSETEDHSYTERRVIDERIKEERRDQDGEHTKTITNENYRRSIDDGDREHKRRRIDGPSTKSPRVEERTSESRRDDPDKAYFKESDTPPEKEKGNKSKEKKSTRKRDHGDEASVEVKRKKEDEASVKSSKRNGEPEFRDRSERHRRDGSSPRSYERRERRSDREEKKHHRSASAAVTKRRL